MNSDQCYHLQWNDHKETLVSVIEKHLCRAYLVDCTLYSEGQYLKAHKLILSACSPFFEKVFKENPDRNPIIVLNEVKFQELKYIVDYMYSGVLEVTGEELGPLLNAAESLQIKGLGNPNEQTKKRKLSNDQNVAQNIVQQFLSQPCGFPPPSQLDASVLSSQNSSEQPTENPQRENGSRRVNLPSKLTEDSQNTQCMIHENHKICKIDETWLKSEPSTSNKSISNITLSTANTELQSKLSLYDNSWPTSVLLFPVPNGAEDVYSADMIPKSELSPDKTKENNESESVVQLDDSGLEDAHIEFVPDPGSIPECEQNKELGHIQDLQQKHLEDVLSTSIIINDTQVAGPSPNIESSSTGSVTKSNSGNEKRKKKSSVTKRKDGTPGNYNYRMEI